MKFAKYFSTMRRSNNTKLENNNHLSTHTSGLKFHYFRIIRTQVPSRSEMPRQDIKTQFSNFKKTAWNIQYI